MSIQQILNATSDTLMVVVDANATTTESRVVVNYTEQTATAPHTPARQVSTTNGTTAVTILSAPGGANIERSTTNIVIWNRDTVDHTYTIYLDVSGTQYNLYTAQSVLAGKSTILSLSGGGGSGSVTSVAMTVPTDILSVAGSPVTGNGTLAVTKVNQSANQVFAGPTSGGAAAPAFRAIVPADVPVMVASGASHAAGLAPDPGATAGTNKYLREDATWVAPPMNTNLVKNPNFDVWENGTAAVPDAYVLTGASATAAREGTIIKIGLYSLKLTRSGTDCTVTQDIYATAGSTFVRDRAYVFGAWVYATVANRARLVFDDGVTQTYSSYHSGGSTWEWLTVTATVNNAASVFNVGLQVATGNTSAYIDGLVVISGGAISSDNYPEHRPFNEFPQRATIWMDEVTYVTGGGKSLFAGGANYPYAYITPTIAANGDVFTASFWIKAGTYTMAVLGATYLNHPILDWTIDAVAAITGQDWYSGGAVYNVVKTGTVTIVGDGYHVLKCTVNGKNASSTNYLYELTKVYFYPSAD